MPNSQTRAFSDSVDGVIINFLHGATTNSQTRAFSASYDGTTQVASAVVCLLLAAISIAARSTIVAGCAAVLIALCYAYSPTAYVVAERSVIVRRLIGEVRLSLDGIREARPVSAADLRDCVRLRANCCLFGYYGLFRTKKLGKCWWYLTSRRNRVVVITKEKTALFSPDDVDGFLGAIQAAVAVPQSPPGEAVTGSPRRRRDRSWILTLVGAAVGLTAIALAVLATLYSPGLPSYTLTPEALTIHDRFYPVTLNPAAVDVARIRMVDISSDPDWRPTERTNGFANAYYRSGWFRVASGRKVRMYCADGRRLVLLPPKGNGVPVLLEVWEPERFVEEVRRLWSGRS